MAVSFSVCFSQIEIVLDQCVRKLAEDVLSREGEAFAERRHLFGGMTSPRMRTTRHTHLDLNSYFAGANEVERETRQLAVELADDDGEGSNPRLGGGLGGAGVWGSGSTLDSTGSTSPR